ncbi:LuxR C-terminal-related transcriptional regulator [Candidatus Leptofilum sp.]|uniref:LuxR C-terminal-related transcriptional regulator n=1 Tax=Candidatus Leptofilum sp. TaxID=3241576 RepID=UPI003B5D031E
MSTPILATKLYIPAPRLKNVSRPRLIGRLNDGLWQGGRFTRKLTLISAPAGFGKTTLATNWIDDLQLAATKDSSIVNRVAWLSLDEGDNDPTRFLAYLIAAWQTVAPTAVNELATLLDSPQPPPPESLLALLINEISSQSGNFLLVLDDYHMIETQAVDQALAFLLEHMPPQMHLVITTREDPPLPLPRYRVRGQLLELRAADLRFTAVETAVFLNQVMGLTLTEDEVAALEARTEGWIAGLQMAALAMQGSLSSESRTEAASFIQAFTGSHRFVLDYLVEEVLQNQPEAVRRFLWQTAVLHQLTAPLCDAVTGQENSQEILELLERSNLFLIPLDDTRQWYRYHHLFADVLQARALAEQPAQIPSLHQRASEWFEQNGFAGEAIRHALAANDFERAAGLIELAWPSMNRNYQTATWLSWARQLPDEMVRTRPVLSVDYAFGVLQNEPPDVIEALLADAEQWLNPSANSAKMVVTDEAQFRSLPGTIATVRAAHARKLNDIDGTTAYAQQALVLLPDDDHLSRVIPASIVGLIYWNRGELAATYHAFTEVVSSFHKAGKLHWAIGPTYILGDILLTQGRLQEAAQTYEKSFQILKELGGVRFPGLAELYLGASEIFREQGDMATAVTHLQTAQKLGTQAMIPGDEARLYTIMARLKMTQGNFADALELLEEADRLFVKTQIPNLRPVAAVRARVWLMQGDLADAGSWAQAQDLSVDDDLSYLREYEHITLARVLIAQGEDGRSPTTIQQASHLLHRLQQAAEATGRQGSLIEILILQAVAQEAQGNTAVALRTLEQAINLAEPEGFFQIFIDEGAPLARLLQKMKDTVTSAERVQRFADKLLAAFKIKQQTVPITASPQPLVEPLSQRELEVLQLIAEGLSNREIGERLFLALNTVKGHNKRIFGKLQVQRRTEAVARARELGLLQS